MKFLLLLLAFITSVSAFAPQSFCVKDVKTVCYAKHVNDKAAKWAKSKRPRKSRPSDINRKPIVYAIHSFQKPTEFSISDEPAVPMSKPSPTEN